MTILCVEDDPAIRTVLKAALKKEGLRYVVADCGPEGVALASEQPLELILLDVNMPGMDGFETFEKIRQLELHRNTPIMFLTASVQQEDQLRGYGLGAEDYVAKPFSPAVLVARVRAVLARQQQKHKFTLPDNAPPDVVEATLRGDAWFDKYILLEELGRGAMGKVRRAWDSRLEIMVALKFLRQGKLYDLERFRREALLLANLSHPNICRIYDVVGGSGQLCIAMQYLDGPPLESWVAEGDRFHNAADLILRVARALSYAHERGIIHRDIKPSNIMLDKEQNPYLMDFGTAKSFDIDQNITPHGVLIGSAGYMSPEQARGTTESVTKLSDVYALGATFYDLLTGHPPFSAGNTMGTIMAVLREEVKPPTEHDPKVPRLLERICLKALRKEPGERYSTADKLADNLQIWIDQSQDASQGSKKKKKKRQKKKGR